MWIFDNCEILEDDDFKLLHDGELHSLVIREVYPEDAGIYYCKAFNAAGEEQCSAKIDVKGENFDVIFYWKKALKLLLVALRLEPSRIFINSKKTLKHTYGSFHQVGAWFMTVSIVTSVKVERLISF